MYLCNCKSIPHLQEKDGHARDCPASNTSCCEHGAAKNNCHVTDCPHFIANAPNTHQSSQSKGEKSTCTEGGETPWQVEFEKTMLITKAGSWLECSDYEGTVVEIKAFISKLLSDREKENSTKILEKQMIAWKAAGAEAERERILAALPQEYPATPEPNGEIPSNPEIAADQARNYTIKEIRALITHQ